MFWFSIRLEIKTSRIAEPPSTMIRQGNDFCDICDKNQSQGVCKSSHASAVLTSKQFNQWFLLSYLLDLKHL